jgi:hypothetical protein
MGWYDETYTRRAAISLDLNATTPLDFDVTIPSEWDDFWDTIDTNGYDLRVVGFDGKTVVSYLLDNGSGGAFSKANRLGRLRIDALACPAITGNALIWLYYAPSTTPQADGAVGSVTMASIRTAVIFQMGPSGWTFGHGPPSPGDQLRRLITKTSSEVLSVWLDYSQFLARRLGPGAGGIRYEELYYATVDVLDSGGTTVATMFEAQRIAFIDSRRRSLVRVTIKAGTDATDYTLVVRVATIAHGGSAVQQVLEDRIKIRVRDTLAT